MLKRNSCYSNSSGRWLSRCLLACLVALSGPSIVHALEVVGVQSISTAQEGATLTLSQYVVPVDGLLVVRVGTHGSASDSVRFDGEEMIHASSLEVTYGTTIAVEMFYLPVEAGDAGSIRVTWPTGGTDQRALIAATVEDATDLEIARVFTDGAVPQNGRIGPNLAEVEVASTQASTLLSAVTVFGNGVPEIVGENHGLDDHPTIPEHTFHEMKFQGGRVMASGPDVHTLGYQNTYAQGYMDYAMIVASFTQAPEPGVATGLGFGVALLASFRRRSPPRR